MAVTGTYTNRDLVTDALFKIGVAQEGETLTGAAAAHGLRALNMMLKAWQNKRYALWTVTEQTITLTTDASYTLDPVRPLRVASARLVRNGIATPMIEMTRQEYDDLPIKTTTGLPTQYYYDRQREAALFYVWPVLSVAAGETVQITYEREIEDQTDLDAITDVPGEWWEAVVYSLADRLSDDYDVNKPKVTQRAEMLLSEALAGDLEGSVYLVGDEYR